MSISCAGLDGCRAGWVLVVARPGRSFAFEAGSMVETFVEAIERTEQCRVVAVDIPISLPEHGEPGGRECSLVTRWGKNWGKNMLHPTPFSRLRYNRGRP
jgi:predicted RNase H-like nuclease